MADVRRAGLVALLAAALTVLSAMSISCAAREEPAAGPGDGDVVGAPWYADDTDRLVTGSRPGNFGNDHDSVFRSLEVSQTEPNVVFVGSEGNGIFRSADGGVTWEWLRRGLRWLRVGPEDEFHAIYPEIYDIMILPDDESTVLALTTNGPGPPTGDCPSALAGLYKSLDGGDTWAQKNEGIINAGLTSFALYPGDPPAVIAVAGTGEDTTGRHFESEMYRSVDGGGSWTPLVIPEELRQKSFWRVVIRGENPPTVFVTAVDNDYWSKWPHTQSTADLVVLMKSEDGCKTWTKINPPNSGVLNFDASAKNPDLIYAVDTDRLLAYRSVDGGENWDVARFHAWGLVKISPFDDQTVFLCQHDRVLRSTDGLATVVTVLEGNEVIQDIEMCRADPRVVYVATRGLLVYKSTDGGASFFLVANLRQYIEDRMAGR